MKPIDNVRYYCPNCGSHDIKFIYAGRRYLMRCNKCNWQHIKYDQFMPLQWTECKYLDRNGWKCTKYGICEWSSTLVCPKEASKFDRIINNLLKLFKLR